MKKQIKGRKKRKRKNGFGKNQLKVVFYLGEYDIIFVPIPDADAMDE
jgi:hypothetical protein